MDELPDRNFAALRERTISAVVDAVLSDDPLAKLMDVLTQLNRQAEMMLGQCDREEMKVVACRAGCDHCCVVNVSVTLPEAIQIAGFLRQLSAVEAKRIFERLDALWRQVRGLDDDERLALRQRCAFLDEGGLCRIYPVRPLFCRSVTSTDAEVCKTAVSSRLLGGAPTLLMYQYQKQLYETLYRSLAEGLKRAGSDDRSHSLTGLVRYLLTHQDSAPKILAGRRLKWLDMYR